MILVIFIILITFIIIFSISLFFATSICYYHYHQHVSPACAGQTHVLWPAKQSPRGARAAGRAARRCRRRGGRTVCPIWACVADICGRHGVAGTFYCYYSFNQSSYAHYLCSLSVLFSCLHCRVYLFSLLLFLSRLRGPNKQQQHAL